MRRGTDHLSVSRKNFFVGVNTGFVTNGEPDRRFVTFYKERCSPALYCAIIGNVVIPGGYKSNDNTPIISRRKVWGELARSIEEQGTVPGIQLGTAWRGYKATRRFLGRNSAGVILQAKRLVRELRPEKLSGFLHALDRATLMACDAGFRHIQLHAAHGYLFSLLVDHRIHEGAPDFLNRLSKWIVGAKSVGLEVSIRISLRTGDKEFDSIGRSQFHDRMSSLPVNFVDVSSGFYNIDKRLIYPSRPDTISARRIETIELARRHPGVQFIFSGRALRGNESGLPGNIHIGLCRDLIANPRYLEDKHDGCKNFGKCHYFSRGENQLECARWRD